MTDTTKSTPQLLTAAEQNICQKIVAQDADVAGQRAATLLAINDGATQAEASAQTGLTMSQIRYLLTTFRKKGLAIFPDDVLAQAQSPGGPDVKKEIPAKKETPSNEVPSDGEASSGDEVTQVPAEAKKEKKTKKDKKDKKDKGKKSKKDKGKDKKKKKGKKSKKSKAKKTGKKKSKK